MFKTTLFIISALLAITFSAKELPDVEIIPYKGRPVIHIDGIPKSLPMYCPVSEKKWFDQSMPQFYQHKMGAYHLMFEHLQQDYFGTMLWVGNQVSDKPLIKIKSETGLSLDKMVADILEKDPGAYIFIRFFMHPPKSWIDINEKELFITETGKKLKFPSMASDKFWELGANYSAAVVKYIEARPWADRVIGYINIGMIEGTHIPVLSGWLYDHSPVMQAKWKAFLKTKYKTVDQLRKAHNNPNVSFETVRIPHDKLRGTVTAVSQNLYWQGGHDNQILRDYLMLQKQLWHQHFKSICHKMENAANRKVLFFHDALKQSMSGWNHDSFFVKGVSDNRNLPDIIAGSGSINVSELFDIPGFDGLMTPYDYQARGICGIMEPEGIVDSAVLRNKFFLCEMDIRTYLQKNKCVGQVRDLQQFKAVSWRNLATALTRGFQFYWMDLFTQWFDDKDIQDVIGKQTEIIKQSIHWSHKDVPGIAMILDDASVLETNGSIGYLNEAILRERKMGLARCGVPYRIYLFEDLKRNNFPAHKVFYFPNLFRVNDEKKEVLKEKVFRNGNVVVWGPGSGISDGQKIGVESAEELTGFKFEIDHSNIQRRSLITNFNHPITKTLSADTIIGSSLPYGPILYPIDGLELGQAWSKNGLYQKGIAIKTFEAKEKKNSYSAIFTTAIPLPAAIWRGIAKFAGVHVYCQSNDIVLANNNIVALYSLKSGMKTIKLPGYYKVNDLISGNLISQRTDTIVFQINAPETRLFLLTN